MFYVKRFMLKDSIQHDNQKKKVLAQNDGLVQDCP